MTDKHSGRPDTESMEELVGRARRGDTDAVSVLYEQTYSNHYNRGVSSVFAQKDARAASFDPLRPPFASAARRGKRKARRPKPSCFVVGQAGLEPATKRL